MSVINTSNQVSPTLTQDKAESSKTVNQQVGDVKPVVETGEISLAEQITQKEVSKAETITPGQLEKVAQQLQDFMGEMNRSLEFLVDKDSGRDVIKVIDKSNGDLIKQYPSEEVLSLVSKLSDATGALVNEKI